MIQLCSLESVFAGKEKKLAYHTQRCAALTKQQVTHTAGPKGDATFAM